MTPLFLLRSAPILARQFQAFQIPLPALRDCCRLTGYASRDIRTGDRGEESSLFKFVGIG